MSKAGNKRKFYCTMEIDGKMVKIKTETGDKYNVIKLDLFIRIRRNENIDQTAAVQLAAYCENTSTTLGTMDFNCT